MGEREARVVAAGKLIETLQAANRHRYQPRERLRGALGQAGGDAHRFEETLNVSASRNALRCQPPCFSLYHRVYAASECYAVFLSAPQVVVALGIARSAPARVGETERGSLGWADRAVHRHAWGGNGTRIACDLGQTYHVD